MKTNSNSTKVRIKPTEPLKIMGVSGNGLSFGQLGEQFVQVV